MNFFRRWQYKRRINKGLCPYCKAKMEECTVFDGEMARPAILCPEIHHGFMFIVTYKDNDINCDYKQLDGGGKAMGIPEYYIRWKHEMEYDIAENRDWQSF